MKLWLDDLRPAPPGWRWAKTIKEAITIIESGEQIEEASFDHDLGQGERLEGYDLLLWMAERGSWPSKGMAVHSMNPVGADKMCELIERYGPYHHLPGTRRFVARR